ncbi:SIMPL domain-containing protein [Alteromonadaceae bacterium BrNp21-10]|nr:SIMPL domain-containing protein [Alteromonadaceae bacterium BrNp21-10]
MQFKSLILLLLLSPMAMAVEHSIMVRGEAVVAAVPDQLQFTVLLEEKGPSTAQLNAKTNERNRLIVNLLRQQGVKDADIQSMRIQLNPWYERTENGNKQSGFVLSRQINVTLRQLDNYALIIDGILAIGADRIERFEYIASNQQEAYNKALVLAVADAKKTASLLAASAETSLGKVISIQQHSNSRAPVAMRMMAMSENAGDLPGEIGVTASVEVVYQLSE